MWQEMRGEGDDHMWDFGPSAWQRGAGRVLRLSLLAFLAAVLLLPSGSALALDTIVVGGSGMPEVEINLDVIEFPEGRMGDSVAIGTLRSKGLLMPGSKVAPRAWPHTACGDPRRMQAA